MKVFVGLALLLSIGSASAQLYKWTDSKGVVHYSDTPRGGDAAPLGKAPAAPTSVALPYELAQAARKFPVTLFTAPGCDACNQGRAYLKQRGIPFVEKTVSSPADIAKLKEAGGGQELPLLNVGRGKQIGFQPDEWATALNAAAYPKKSMLPSTYRFQSVSAADPMVIPPPPAAPKEQPGTEPAPKKTPRTDLPPGFQF